MVADLPTGRRHGHHSVHEWPEDECFPGGIRGGITAGNARIRNGVGIFTEVWDINELIGDYRGASGQSGATRPARPNVITRGHVSLTLTRTRAGWNLGVTGGNFTIQRAGDVP